MSLTSSFQNLEARFSSVANDISGEAWDAGEEILPDFYPVDVRPECAHSR